MNHWRLEEKDRIAILTLDVADKAANALSQSVLRELDQVLLDLGQRPLAGLIVRSAKTNGFIVGADVYEFEKVIDAARAAELTRAGQLVMNRLGALPFPTVALINGACLGGGLELALACRYRIALDDDKTRLGLPEVRLGIHPGFGGTVRLPALVGDLPALDLILSGRTLSTSAARKLGLVDEVVPERHLLRAAYSFIATQPPARRPSAWKRLPSWAPARPLVARFLRAQLAKKAKANHYPAPYRALELWERGADQEQEAVSCAELLVGHTSRNLVSVFKLGEDLKRAGRKVPHRIKYVHVIGAGVMGADIAIWAAYKGFYVSLQDRHPEILARAMKKAHDFFRKQLKKPTAVQAALDRLMPDVHGSGLAHADLVIEAIVENVEAKTALFRDIEQKVRGDAVLATNTSSIPLEMLARALRDPARLVGLHFFNPVAKMQLVEIVRGAQTAEAIMERARAFTGALDRLPLDVKSSPGFLVNRILMPYLMEAMMMVEEGIPIAHIDQAATDFGMPMGPVLLADTVGLDICLSVAEMLSAPLGIAVPETLRAMVARGELGKKSGKGFYRYEQGKPVVPEAQPMTTHVPIAERLVLRLINEAGACLREGVVADADAVDAGMVYGTGFAPFLGGPMRYAESLGDGVAQNLRRLAQEYGERFEPDAAWSKAEVFNRRILARA
jgi:3-hydroxyacyl-CoA dehydrogenase/enoyl-CoA hydratase/3-hydroxybutyryl-CoA epimerase